MKKLQEEANNGFMALMSKKYRDRNQAIIRSGQKVRAAIYVRAQISQEVDKTVPLQIEQCKAYCNEQGYSVAEDHMFVDRGSGIDRTRPNLQKMLAAAENNAFEVIVTVNYDRISRNQTHFALIMDRLEQHAIEIESIGYRSALKQEVV